ncbi:MAG: ABC transporter permease [Planctomycetota bacterium]
MKNYSKTISLLFRSQLGAVLAFLVIALCFAVADYFYGSGNFVGFRNMRSISHSAALIAVPALGMTIIIIAGGIDLSAGTALTLCGTVFASMLKFSPVTNEASSFGGYILIALLVTLATGCICGLINGLLISTTKVVPFIVTLGTMTIFLGIGQIIAQESTVYAPPEHVPLWLQNLCYTGSNIEKYNLIRYVPTDAILAIFLAVSVGLLLKFTIFGRNVFALGSSELTARLCGINVFLTRVFVYTLAGLFVALGSLLYYANVKNGNPTDGQGMELDIIAAVVLGGGSLSGGRGSILGTMIGALIIVVIQNGCDLLQIPNTVTLIAIGCIIIIAVVVDQFRQKIEPSKAPDAAA